MRHYREIPQDRVLKFKATSGFKGWKHFFTKESVNHPAKMNLNLLKWILTTYTTNSDIVLDPMAGTGSTIILASTMGRNGIAVEYEPTFCKMIEENIHKTKNHHTLTNKGTMICINGDARELSKYLIEANIVISSPPYGNRLSDVAIKDGDPARMGYRQAIDVVLSSPPYGSDNANLQGREDKSALSVLQTTGMRSISLQEDNLGNLDGETYLSEMLKVYSECFKILKSSGKLILVVKNFIREKQVIRLDLDTIKLCESAGFRLFDRWYFDLPLKSFWLNLYHQKYPDVPQVKYEDILIFEKNVGVPPISRTGDEK